MRKFTVGLLTLSIFLLFILPQSLAHAQSQTYRGHLDLGQTVIDSFQLGYDNVWTFYAQPGDMVEVVVVSDTFSPYLDLIDADGNTISSSVTSYENGMAYIPVYVVNRNDIHYIRLRSVDGYGGQYAITLGSVTEGVPLNTIYNNSMQGNVGSEWNLWNQRTTTADGQTFLGRFSNERLTFWLYNLAEHDHVRLEFDLYVIGSWDGNSPDYGPDIWEMRISSPDELVLRTTFSNVDGNLQSFPSQYPAGNAQPREGSTIDNSLGYSWYGDTTYRFQVDLSHSESSLFMTFQGIGLEGVVDESWGIDNVRVSISKQLTFQDVSMCLGGPPTNLRPGMTVRNTRVIRLQPRPGDNDNIFNQLNEGRELYIQDGPACIEGVSWWQIRIGSNGAIGWIPEILGGQSILSRVEGTRYNMPAWLPLSYTQPQIEPVISGELNCRMIPSINLGAEITDFQSGQALGVISRTLNGRWFQVSTLLSNGQIAFCWVCAELTRGNHLIQSVPASILQIQEDCYGRVDTP